MVVKFERFIELHLSVLAKFHTISSRSWMKSFALHDYRSYLFLTLWRAFVTGKHFQPSLIFKAKICVLVYQSWALRVLIRITGFERSANTLAYHKLEVNYNWKSSFKYELRKRTSFLITVWVRRCLLKLDHVQSILSHELMEEWSDKHTSLSLGWSKLQ